jgi:hypothetical protein
MGAAVSFEIKIPIVAFIPVWAEALPTSAGETDWNSRSDTRDNRERPLASGASAG